MTDRIKSQFEQEEDVLKENSPYKRAKEQENPECITASSSKETLGNSCSPNFNPEESPKRQGFDRSIERKEGFTPEILPSPSLIRSDAELIYLWLQHKSMRTIESYRFEIKRFMKFSHGVQLKELTISFLYSYAEKIRTLPIANSSKALCLSAIKSLLSFA